MSAIIGTELCFTISLSEFEESLSGTDTLTTSAPSLANEYDPRENASLSQWVTVEATTSGLVQRNIDANVDAVRLTTCHSSDKVGQVTTWSSGRPSNPLAKGGATCATTTFGFPEA